MATHSSILAWEVPWRGAWMAIVHRAVKGQTRLSTRGHTHTRSLYNAHCARLCCAVKGISSVHTQVLSLADLRPILPPIPAGPQGHQEAPSWASCALEQVPTSYFIHGRKSSFTLGFPSLFIPSSIETSQVYPTACCWDLTHTSQPCLVLVKCLDLWVCSFHHVLNNFHYYFTNYLFCLHSLLELQIMFKPT